MPNDTMSVTETAISPVPEVVIPVPVGYTQRKEKISFRTVKTKDKEGKLISEEKRPTLEVVIPSLTFDGLTNALENDKQRDFILEVMNDAIYAAARAQTDRDESPANTQAELDFSRMTIEFIANQPKAQRGTTAIDPAVWEAFGKDYVLTTLKNHTERNAQNVGNAGGYLAGKLTKFRNNKQVVGWFQQELEEWSTNTENLEEFFPCYNYLESRMKDWMVTPEQTTDALM